MGFRFQKRITMFKGIKLNLSKSGVSVSVGRPGASLNLGGKGTTANVGVPGTGLSDRERISERNSAGLGGVIFLLVVLAVVGAFFL